MSSLAIPNSFISILFIDLNILSKSLAKSEYCLAVNVSPYTAFKSFLIERTE